MNFIPKWFARHKKTDDAPLALGGAVGILFVAIFSLFGLTAANRYMLQSEQFAAVISSVIADLVNTDRTSYNLKGLTWNPILAAAAELKAKDMATKGYFAHVAPDGTDSWYWFRKAGYPFAYAGENLAVDFSDSIDVERAWMNSPTHRANILNGRYTHIGIATAQGVYQGRSTTFVVQMFGVPAKTQAPTVASTLPKSPTQIASGTAATSTPKQVPTTPSADPVLGESLSPEEVPDYASMGEHLIASPKTMLEYGYYLFAIIALVILGVVTRFEFERHHHQHFLAVAMLFFLMFLLFTFATTVFFTTPALAAIVTS